jgi:hypothetical protein
VSLFRLFRRRGEPDLRELALAVRRVESVLAELQAFREKHMTLLLHADESLGLIFIASDVRQVEAILKTLHALESEFETASSALKDVLAGKSRVQSPPEPRTRQG